jgi:hypothetical protein
VVPPFITALALPPPPTISRCNGSRGEHSYVYIVEIGIYKKEK